MDAPRMMPVAGWYLDPEIEDTWRYWDGAHWTQHRAPAGPLPKADPHSFSEWFTQSVKAVVAVLWPTGVAVLIGWVVAVVPLIVFAFVAADSAEGREVRSLLETDAVGTVSLTDAEADRLGELLIDIGWSSIPWLGVAAVLGLLVATWGFSLVVHAASRGRHAAAGGERVPFGDLVVVSLRRVPAVAGSFVVVSFLLVVLAALLFAPMFFMLVADAGETAVVLTALFGGLALVVLMTIVSVRLSLAFVLAALGGHGLGVRRSWELTDERFWGVLGRGIVAGVIASTAGSVLSAGLGFALAFGVAFFVAVIVVFQAVTNAVNLVVVVPSQVVLAEHLAQRAAS